MKEFLTRTAQKVKSDPATTLWRGLSASAIVWLYATFATQKDVAALQEANKAQWRAIAELRGGHVESSTDAAYRALGLVKTNVNGIEVWYNPN